ncbi:MAG: hypothetical protein ACK56F_32965, partial [bacterium]
MPPTPMNCSGRRRSSRDAKVSSRSGSGEHEIKPTTARKPLRDAARLRMVLGVRPSCKRGERINFCMICSQN